MRWPWQRRELVALKAPAQGDVADGDKPAETPPTINLQIGSARKLFRHYPATELDPQRYQRILRQADIGYPWQLMELLDDVASDPKVGSELRKRKLSVAGKPWCTEPPAGDTSDLAKQIAEEAEAFARRIPNFVQLRIDLLDAPFRGFACSVPEWAYVRGRFDIVGHKPIETRFFRFDEGGDRPLVETDNAMVGEPLPDGVLFHVARDKAGTMVRGGIGRSVGKIWLYKNLNLIDGVSFLERFGQPHVQVNLPPNVKPGSDEFERAKSAALSFIADQVGLVPPGVEIKVVEAIQKAATLKDMYVAFWRWCDEAIALAINNQTLTSESGDGGFGHGAEAKQHGDTAQATTELDAAQLDETLTQQLFKPWTAYHYGPDAPAPTFRTLVEPPEDEQAKATTLKTRADTLVVLNRGLKLPLSKNQVRTEFNALEPDGDDDTIEPSAAPAPPPPGSPPPEDAPIDPKLSARDGACPHCNGFFTLAEAEKKKRSVLWGLSRT